MTKAEEDEAKRKAKEKAEAEAAESAPASANAAVLRPGVKTTSESIRETTSGARILEAADAPANSPDGGPRNVRCQIIREGLGNRVDMHFYGPQSIQDIGRLINGAKCFINHPTKTESTNQPEGNLWAECGYWKDGIVVEVEGKLAVQATLVCDDTEAGKQAMGKANHCMKYAADFPGLTEVYAGFSINGGGDIAPADVDVDGASMRVEYVRSVTQLPRVDMVTRPAREGKVLGLVESEKNQEEKRTMMKTMIEAMSKYFAGLKLLASAKPDVQAIGKIVEEGEAAVAAMKTKAEEDEAAEAAAKAANGEEVPPAHAEPDGDEPAPGAKPGAVSQVRIKHEETRTTRQADVARIADLEKKLAEANAKIALTESKKDIEAAGISESLTPEMLSAITDPAARVAVFAIAKKLHESNPFGIGNPARSANGTGGAGSANAFVDGLADRLNRRG
jgi:hypothetical protein